jgi:hypothetical protein
MEMVRYRTLVLATALLAILAGAVHAAPTSAGRQTFTASFLTIGGVDKPTFVVADGPIAGVATATQTEKQKNGAQINYVVLHFERGTVRITAVEPRFGFTPRAAPGAHPEAARGRSPAVQAPTPVLRARGHSAPVERPSSNAAPPAPAAARRLP